MAQDIDDDADDDDDDMDDKAWTSVVIQSGDGVVTSLRIISIHFCHYLQLASRCFDSPSLVINFQ